MWLQISSALRRSAKSTKTDGCVLIERSRIIYESIRQLKGKRCCNSIESHCALRLEVGEQVDHRILTVAMIVLGSTIPMGVDHRCAMDDVDMGKEADT